MPPSPPTAAPPSGSPTASCASPRASKTSTISRKTSLRRWRRSRLLDLLLHSDKKLLELVAAYGPWIYAILFTIVFAETGFVVTPFLPGDSLLFATGALCATGALSTPMSLGLLFAAAFLGNAVNYSVGRFIGPRVFTRSDSTFESDPGRLLNREYLDRGHAFFEQYGGKAVVMGRFVPIVRTFVPFVAGAAQMTPHVFASYNVIGAAAWVGEIGRA